MDRKVLISLVVLLGFAWTGSTSHPGFAAGQEVRQSLLESIREAESASARQDWENSLRNYLSALEIAHSQGMSLITPALRGRIGDLYDRRGRSQFALQEYEQGLVALTTGGDETASSVDEALERLRGTEKTFTSDQGGPFGPDLYDGTIENLERFVQTVPGDCGSATCSALRAELAALLALQAGNMYQRQAQYGQSAILYDQAMAHAKTAGLVVLQRKIAANKAWSAISQGAFSQAAELLQQLLGGDFAETPPIELRRALLAVGVRLRETGELSSAGDWTSKAIELYRQAEDERGLVRALSHLATTQLLQGDLEGARSLYVEALQLNGRVGDEQTAWHANGGLAKTYHRLDRLSEAQRHYEAYLDALDRLTRQWQTDQGRIGILEDHSRIFQDYVLLSLRVAEQESDFSIARQAVERGRTRALEALLESRGRRPPREPGSIPAGQFLYRERWPHYQVEFSLGVDAGEPTSAGVSVRQMAPAVDSGPPAFEAALPPPIEPPAVTFLEYYTIADRVAILVKDRGGRVNGSVGVFSGQSLADLVFDHGRALKVEQPRGVSLPGTEPSDPAKEKPPVEEEVAFQLYRLLVEPVQAHLPEDPDEKVVIVPHGVLWLVPFAALRSADMKFFGDQHVLSYAPSEASWRLIATRQRSRDHRKVSAWVLGNPIMPAQVQACGLALSFDALHGAEQEAREIAVLLGQGNTRLFLGGQADLLRLEAWHSEPSLIHLATHGMACPDDPLSSFILLTALGREDLEVDLSNGMVSRTSDPRFPVSLRGFKEIQDRPFMPSFQEPGYPGLLEARKIISEFRLDADLVTLSACQTGLGRLSGEGQIGFARAFLAAGARSLLVSLWRVDDQSTRLLMVEFYRQYLKHGDKGRALQGAMKTVREVFPEPRYWAAFVLLGMSE